MHSKREDMSSEFLRDVQRHNANAFGISVIRNMVAKRPGTLHRLKQFLTDDVDLAEISSVTDFPSKLNSLTDHLSESAGLPWGASRKALNIFLRDALYNHYLRCAFQLQQIETALEVPLDGDVGKALRTRPEGMNLPRWTRSSVLARMRALYIRILLLLWRNA